jgi:hypothetical protein
LGTIPWNACVALKTWGTQNAPRVWNATHNGPRVLRTAQNAHQVLRANAGSQE